MARQSRNKEVAATPEQRDPRLPYVPEIWPAAEEFRAAFERTAKLRQRYQEEADEERRPLVSLIRLRLDRIPHGSCTPFGRFDED